MCSDTMNEKRMAEKPWMTVKETAAYLSVSPGTVRNMVSERRIPFVKRGRIVRFHRQRIDEWLSRGACKGRVSRAPTVQELGEDVADIK
jgi:excisionase family DNA binding protein